MSTLCTTTGAGIINAYTCANEITGGIIGASILLGVWLLIYFQNRTTLPREAATAASWITLLVAALLRVGGMIEDTYLGITFVIAIGSLALLVFNSR
jgi:hypothetical protein